MAVQGRDSEGFLDLFVCAEDMRLFQSEQGVVVLEIHFTIDVELLLQLEERGKWKMKKKR